MADRESQEKDTGKLRREAHKRAKLSKEARQEREVIKGEERESSNRHPDGILAHLSMNPVWFLTAVAAMVAVLVIPTGDDLSVTGQRALAILAFAIILWVT